MEIVEGLKRFSKMYIDKFNFGYRMNRKRTDGKLFLRCHEESCHGSGIYTPEDGSFKSKTKHNHKPDIQMISKWRFLQRLKLRVETEDKSLSAIYQEECLNYPDVEHPPFNRLKSTLWKRRQLIRSSEKLLPEDTKETLNLFQFDESSKRQLEQHFHEAGNIHLDEALKVIPHMFTEFDSHFPTEGNIVEIVEGPKRYSRVFIDDAGYAYQQNKKRKEGTLFLRCHTEGCGGTGIFNPETTSFRRGNTHFHHPSQNAVQKLRFLQKVKLRAENETTNLSTIYSEEASRFRGTPLPSYEKIKSTLRKRRVASLLPKGSGGSASSLSKECLEKEKEVVATHYIARKGMEVIEGPKRFSRIYIDDHSYCYLVNRKKTDGSLILKCHEEGCRGSGRYNPSESFFHKMAKHSHYADPLLVTKWRFLHQCKRRAENETTPIKSIYEQESLRHPNCNLPSFKKIESTLQKRRKSNRLKEEGPAKAVKDSLKASDFPRTRELEVQLEEVYHPEGNPRYFLSPNISYKAPAVSQENSVLPAPIIVKTGKVQKFNFPLGKAYPMPNFLKGAFPNSETSTSNKSPKKTIKSVKKKGRKRKDESLTSRKTSRSKRLRAMEPRRPSDYTSKMDVMEGTKRFSKIFIDESQHVYQLNKSRLDGALILKCYESACHGSGLYLPAEEIFQRSAEHSHDPSPDLVAKCRLLSSLKARAEIEDGPLRTIYEEEVAKYPGIEIPSFRQMESTLQKRRRAKVPSEPHSLREAAFELQRTDFSKCSRGNFFRTYLNFEGHEILVFVSPGPLEKKFNEAKTFHLDGTFRVIPQGFAQVVVVHLVMQDHVFPVVYALMNTRSNVAYTGFFEFLKEEFPGFDPQFVSSDYEFELKTSFQSVFPNSIVSGCWFYYTQAVWRQLRTCGLAQIFFQDEEAKAILKCVMALPLLPSLRISSGIRFLQSKISKSSFHLKETKKSLFKVIDFIEEHWVQKVGVNTFSVFGFERKLNYDIEALNQFFIKKLGIETPPLIKFVEKVFQAEAVILSDFEQKVSGKRIRLDRSRRCNENEKMLKKICDKFEASVLNVDQFLLAASSAVPRHCHHDDAVCDDDDETSSQDPSDIPGSLPFCEIRVVAPTELSQEQSEKPHLAGIELDTLRVSENDSLIIGELSVTPNIQDIGSIAVATPQSPSQSQCHSDTERKDFASLENVWPSPLPPTATQPHNYIVPHQPPLHFSHTPQPIHHTEQENLQQQPQNIPTNHPNVHQSQQQLSLQHLSHALTNENHYHHNQQPQHHIPETNLGMEETDNLCEVRLVDNKSEVFLYYPHCHKS